MSTPEPDTALATVTLEKQDQPAALVTDRNLTLADLAQRAPQAIEAVVGAMAQATQIINRAALGLTRPEDWVLNQDKEGNVTAMLGEGACRRIASLIGLRVVAYYGPEGGSVTEPVIVTDESGIRSAVIIAQFDVPRLGMEGMLVRAERSEAEQFTGRKGNIGDLKSAAMSLIVKKAVHAATGVTKAPARILAEAGIDLNLCRKGHGYGSSESRRAAPQAPQAATAPTVPPGAMTVTVIGSKVGKRGTGSRGEWVLYFVQTSEGDFGTFSESIAEDARQASGRRAVIEWKPSPKGGGREILSIVAEDPAEPAPF